MEQVFNPYLPLTEYIPDGEPHVFNDRVYIYGSHDKSEGKAYCEDDYVTWSAPIDNPKDWRYEGVIYRKNQDPLNLDGSMQLWAPDVVQGSDKRYYLYYCFGFYPAIGVAVSDSPAGPFEFYGHVKYPDSIKEGKLLDDHMPFDPAVMMDDNGKIYLYWGFCPACEKEMEVPQLNEEMLAGLPDNLQKVFRILSKAKFEVNSQVAELEGDMLTLKEEPRPLIPSGKTSKGTGFEDHAFFEASSIRKINGKYYFVYSSHKSHELCYAISDKPDREFRYGGVIISNGNIGLNGNKKPTYTLSNNHGGIVKLSDGYYIFYHRATQGTEFSRQGCAEKIKIENDGTIEQVETTSCGLNQGALIGTGSYPAGICCHMTCRTTKDTIDYSDPIMQKQTRVTQEKNVSFVTDIEDGTILGYKYFSCENISDIIMEIRGDFRGKIVLSSDKNDRNILGKTEIEIKEKNWVTQGVPCSIDGKNIPIYISFWGDGYLDLKSFTFKKRMENE